MLNLLDRMNRNLWRRLLRWRRIILALAALWAAALLAALARGGPRWLDAAVTLYTAPELPGLSRLVWALTTLLFGTAALILLADWFPGWWPPPADWANWARGEVPSPAWALSRLEALDLPARLSVMPVRKGRVAPRRQAVLSTPPGWLVGLQCALGAGLLLTLLALGIVASRGWSSDSIELVVGQRRAAAARDRRAAVSLQEVRFEPQPSGPAKISAMLSVETPGGIVHAVHIAQGERKLVQGVQVDWVDHGAAYRLRAKDANNMAIPLRQLYANQQGDTLRVPFDDAQQEKWAALPEQGLLLRMALAPDGNEPYVNARLIAGADGEVLAEADVYQTETLAIEDVTVEIVPEAFVRVALADGSHLATSWLALGLLGLGVLALAAEMLAGRETVWMVLDPIPADELPESERAVDPSVTMDHRYPTTRWLAGGSSADGEPDWLDDVTAYLEGAGPQR